MSAVESRRGETKALAYPFERVRHVFRASDLSFCNLECVHTLSTQRRPVAFKKFYVRGRPEHVRCLSGVFDLAGVANNHIMDYGGGGLRDTLAGLDAAGIRHVGAGTNEIHARTAIVFRRQGVRVGFLATTRHYLEGIYAGPGRAGSAGQPEKQTESFLRTLEADVRNVKMHCDVLVVSIHWGIEREPRPTEEQREIAHAIVDAGADVILGHHPHVLQGIERHGKGLIAYSLGNFNFGANTGGTRDSVILQVKLTREGVRGHRVLPVRVFPPETRFRPWLLEGDDAARVLARMERLSAFPPVTSDRP
jgi:poly-gamma-glutamate synthesis protein (capsule biosynthesis protein)